MPSILNSLKLLADPTRLRILLLLSSDPLSVAELQQILSMGQSRISTQLSQLKKEGLVEDQRSGKNNIYSASLPPQLEKVAREAGKELPETKQDFASLKHILQKRKDHVRAYFDQLAGKFGREYVPGRSWKSLAEAMLKILNYDTVADLGAGEGTLSQLLAQRAKHVIAIDNSEKMVTFGQSLARDHKLPNLEYRLGDIESPPIDDASVDLAIFSQALHHANHPEKAIAEAHRILKPGGRLIILDLLQHTFEKARELYFDTWLGFSEVELVRMISEAGFQDTETVVVDRESTPPYFQTLLATAAK
ncbi:metalloregulator ArsR/SmtB family transcription factor [Akkermansiaceae bacterium]|jgi:ubiquinone/menaquinone biosynthesis C-methylase UbiE/biotin operon repressor|nr:metalloregulator ArsR/SmtB family transcription factor [Akkermansiaceae bacterium]MDB4519954.1 metalloregulator ArsR/SmtB family transcription factor [Akkermansiaceae bacterium]|tara:strand:+ start:761 stop:1675 length:915 start_codon:yes stop_codon:yes gene_type:complete